MEEARRHYDYVIIDTPPLTPIQDCRVIGRWVDGFLLVVAAHRTPRRLVADALTALDKAKVLGFVFNEDDRSTKGPVLRPQQLLLTLRAGRAEPSRRTDAGRWTGRRVPPAPRRRAQCCSIAMERPAVMLALLEVTTLFGAIAGALALSGTLLSGNWIDVAVVLAQAAALSACCVVAFYYNDLYDLRIVRSFGGFASRLPQAFGVAMMLLAGVYVLVPPARIAHGPFYLSIVLMVGFLLPARALGYSVMRRGAFADRVLIVGMGPLARKLIREIDAHPHLGYHIVGVLDDGPVPNDYPLRHPFLGPLEGLLQIAKTARIDRVIVALRERRGRMPVAQLLALEAHGVPVEDGLRTYEQITKKLAIETLSPSQLIFSDRFRTSRAQAALRRLLSLVAAAVGLALTAPLIALIALAIKLDSAGPVFFVHERLGLRGRAFRLVKFRTMRPIDVRQSTSEWVSDNEDRITRVGHWLRTFRLDELPQFLNILRGDMNLVGPRPHPVSNASLFAENIPYYVLRTAVRPGVTGWAQVRYGYANNLEEEIEKMRYDLYYIEHLSLWFDLRILFDTVKTVLFGRGSYVADAYLPGRASDVSQVASLSHPARPIHPRTRRPGETMNTSRLAALVPVDLRRRGVVSSGKPSARIPAGHLGHHPQARRRGDEIHP